METNNARRAWAGDLWGGLAAMLVALPSAIAFGVTIFSPLGPGFGPQGAMAGILGATALGLIASTFGGTDRLITAPCAPAAALLAALTIDLNRQGVPPETVILMLVLIGLLAGALQIGFGLSGIGRLIRFIPYPVVSGYLTAVGITIIAGQLPRVLGADKEQGLWQALFDPGGWHWESLLVGAIVIAVMAGAPRLIRAVPAAIIALIGGVLAYLALGFANPALWQTQGNPLVVGPLSAGEGQLLETLLRQAHALGDWNPALLAQVFMPALSLAALLSIDTLKTCVVLDAMTASHHNPDREMIGQGLGNMGSALIGGIPGAGTMGASLVNVSSGAQTRRSGTIEGLFALLAFLLLSSLVAWVPIAALGAILLVVGYRMIDWHSLEFFRTRSTRFDFLVILTVIAVALVFNLVAASGAGIVLAVVLFLREQTRSTVLRRKLEGGEMFSRVVRHEIELQVLLRNGSKTVIVELQGALFFGTANQLYQALEPEIGQRTYVILNLRRVQSLDLTATHALEQIKERLEAAGAYLIFTEIPRGLPSGLKMKRYLKEVGLVRESEKALAFRDLDQALEWIEHQMLSTEPGLIPADPAPLELEDLEGLLGWKPGSLTRIAPIIETRQYAAGTKVLNLGGPEDELVFIRKGTVRVVLPLQGKDHWHIGTFGRGDFIGEMGFLDPSRRAADATALDEVSCFVLARHRFNELADSQSEAAAHIFEGIACVLAMRVRFMNKELRALRT
ncbi:SulP family inorganic anion transporter [Niveibacterium sp. 24ML]|uniref:SLC26A/SulP transporter family protein n=1 Tax=Niveibacterium sp. 24ML TaxID=2985512 RepID=UPI0022719CD3|nr:SulP family inorganic anion transporter [Niveibacterium sp. 24ML]MCX9154968.1 SulP family inorganic anion transporter [Niveibacterium sp. 24ML]